MIYFNFKDFKENKKEILQQLEYEGYDCWLVFRINNLIAIYTFILGEKIKLPSNSTNTKSCYKYMFNNCHYYKTK